jgi:uncharacterized protein with FMN-binding domain
VSDHGSRKKVSNGLVALSSAAVLAVYAAGYVRTKSAADRFTLQAEARRPVIPAPSSTPPPTTPLLPSVGAITSAGSSPSEPEKARKAPRRTTKRPTQTVPSIVASAPVVTAEVPAAIVEQAAATPVPVLPDRPKSQYKDGIYLGWGTSRHGDIQAQVVIENGRIASATIAQCLTRYSCSVIAKLPPQVAERQSPETDYVSGATQSTNAFYYAVVEALSKAK